MAAFMLLFNAVVLAWNSWYLLFISVVAFSVYWVMLFLDVDTNNACCVAACSWSFVFALRSQPSLWLIMPVDAGDSDC
jgi:hypothetical protein